MCTAGKAVTPAVIIRTQAAILSLISLAKHYHIVVPVVSTRSIVGKCRRIRLITFNLDISIQVRCPPGITIICCTKCSWRDGRRSILITICDRIYLFRKPIRSIISKTNYDSVSKTFEVIAQQSSNGKTIKQVDAAVWSEENGQDDIKWYSTSDISNGQARVRFNLANHDNRATPLLPRMFHGTGDIFAAVLVGRILQGNVPQAAVQAAAAFVAECIRQTPEGADERLGVWLENALPKLRQE